MENWHDWLLGITDFDQRAYVWRSLAQRILVRPERELPEAVRDSLQRLGELVAAKR